MRGLVCGALLLAAGWGMSAARAGEWKPLFNGKNLDGWQAIDGPLSSWHVEDGILYCSGGGGGWLSTDKEYSDFEIELEFRVPPGGNSGVFLRAPHEGNPAFAGMEIQVLDDRADEYANLEKYQYCGSLYGITPPSQRVSKPAGEWQTLKIKCQGRRVQVTLNGTEISDTDLDQQQAHAETHPGINRRSGYIGLQSHGTRLDYRNLRIRELNWPARRH
jgi:hypothetical protein